MRALDQSNAAGAALHRDRDHYQHPNRSSTQKRLDLGRKRLTLFVLEDSIVYPELSDGMFSYMFPVMLSRSYDRRR